MKLSRLERASDYEIREWLDKKIQFTPYQKSLINDREIFRLSPFYFYKQPKKEKVSFWWRLTIVVYVFYWIILIILMPIKWMITGKSGYGRNFLDKFHNVWVRKIGIV